MGADLRPTAMISSSRLTELADAPLSVSALRSNILTTSLQVLTSNRLLLSDFKASCFLLTGHMVQETPTQPFTP